MFQRERSCLAELFGDYMHITGMTCSVTTKGRHGVMSSVIGIYFNFE